MFHVTRNIAMSGTRLLQTFEQQLRLSLPSSWRLVARETRRSGGNQGIDAELELSAPDRTQARLLVEVKRAVEPRDVAATVARINAYKRRRRAGSGQQLAVVAAPYLSPMARERLAGAGAGWFDATGNLRVQLDRPGLFIDRVGAPRSPFTDPDDRRLKSLRGGAAARVVRALLDGGGEPRGVRALAAEAQVGNASSSRVLELLTRDDIIERDVTGAVVAVSKQALARRWAQDYGLTATNNSVSVLAPRGIDRLLSELVRYQQQYALTGSAAARVYLPQDQPGVTPLVLPVVFVPNAVRAQSDLGMRPAERGGNVLLVEPFDDVVYRGATSVDGLRYVAPSQAVADLLTGPGRSAEEADQLLDALARKDPGWAR